MAMPNLSKVATLSDAFAGISSRTVEYDAAPYPHSITLRWVLKEFFSGNGFP